MRMLYLLALICSCTSYDTYSSNVIVCTSPITDTFTDATRQRHIAVKLTVPLSYNEDCARKRKLLIYLNGYGGDGGSIVGRFQHLGIENELDAFLLAPTGATSEETGKRRWIATPACCEPSINHPSDADVYYLSDLILRVVAAGWPIDMEAIFILGVSNGGAMGVRMGCARPDLIRGVVSIAGIGMSGGVTCGPGHVHFAFHHSQADSTFLYNGGGPLILPPPMPATYPSVDEAIAQLRTKNECTGLLQLTTPYAYDFDYPGPTYPMGVKDTDLWKMSGCPSDGTIEVWISRYPALQGFATYGHSPHTTAELGIVVKQWLMDKSAIQSAIQ